MALQNPTILHGLLQAPLNEKLRRLKRGGLAEFLCEPRETGNPGAVLCSGEAFHTKQKSVWGEWGIAWAPKRSLEDTAWPVWPQGCLRCLRSWVRRSGSRGWGRCFRTMDSRPGAAPSPPLPGLCGCRQDGWACGQSQSPVQMPALLLLPSLRRGAHLPGDQRHWPARTWPPGLCGACP